MVVGFEGLILLYNTMCILTIFMQLTTIQSSVVPLLEGPETHSEVVNKASDDTSQVSEVGHFCLPSESQVQFTPLSQQIRQEFISLLKHGSVEQSHTHSTAVETSDAEMIEYEVQKTNQHTQTEATPPPSSMAQKGPGYESYPSSIAIPIVTVVASSLVSVVIALVVTRINNRHQRQQQVSAVKK